ncbi:MAG: WD40/YVTN/BNR-like repeat-containing protein [Myxococcota bacterium]
MGSRRRRIAVGGALVVLLLAAATEAFPGPLEPGQKTSWQPPNPDLYAVAARGDHVWAVGYWGAVLRSQDAGATWTVLQTPTHATLSGVSFADERNGWVVGQMGAVLRTRDGGDSWEPQRVQVEDETGGARPLGIHLFAVAAVSPTAAWAVGDLGVVIRTEDGERWRKVELPESLLADGQVPDRIYNAVVFSDPAHGWIVGEFGTTLRTSDGGATWTSARTFVDAVEELYLFDVSAPDARRAAAVGLGGSVVVTDDGGATWRGRSVDTSAGLFGVVWNDERATVVGDRGEIYATGDRGASWKSAQRPRLFNWIQAVAGADAARLYAVGEKGLVLASSDGGASWSQLLGREPPPSAAISIPEAGPRADPGLQEQALPVLGEPGGS